MNYEVRVHQLNPDKNEFFVESLNFPLKIYTKGTIEDSVQCYTRLLPVIREHMLNMFPNKTKKDQLAISNWWTSNMKADYPNRTIVAYKLISI